MDNPIVEQPEQFEDPMIVNIDDEQYSLFPQFPEEHQPHLAVWTWFFRNPVPVDVVRVHPFAKMPTKGNIEKEDHVIVGGFSTIFNLGLDIFCVPDEEWTNPDTEEYAEFTLMPFKSKTFSTGIKIATPPNWGFLLRDRSGMGVRDITVEAGVIEGTYRNEWKIHLINLGTEPRTFQSGDKIVQAILTPIIPIQVNEREELPPTKRDTRGFGSSGR